MSYVFRAISSSFIVHYELHDMSQESNTAATYFTTPSWSQKRYADSGNYKVKVATFALAMHHYSLGRWLLQNFLPHKLYSNVVKHNQFCDNMVRRRLNLKVERPDFLSEV